MKFQRNAFLILILSLIFTGMNTRAEQDVMIWVSPGSPDTIWKKGYGEDYPARMIMKTIKDAGFTDFCFFLYQGRGGAFYYPTKVKYAKTDKIIGSRDWLEETLSEADKYNLKVWAIYTPSYKIPGTEIKGFRSPEMLKFYEDTIDEIGKNYKPKHKSLHGIMLHEFNCAEVMDMHRDELKEFSEFCENNFNEKYTGEKMPDLRTSDKWSTRFYLYKADSMNTLCKTMKKRAAQYGLETFFCLYNPETGSSSANWGYDTVELEKICDRFWVAGSGYKTLKNPYVETSLSYKGINLPLNLTKAFHGKAISFFEYRSMLFPEINRKAYNSNTKFTKIYGDLYTGYIGRSQKVLDLFHGPENVAKWNNLQKEWIGAKDIANIAILSSSMPFILRYPTTPGVKYKKVLGNFRDSLMKYFPVDLLLLDSQFTLDPEKLKNYDLLIIPEEMGIAMSDAMIGTLKKYLANGGKLFAMGSRVSSANKDLTSEKDYTEDIFGIRISDKKVLPGYTRCFSSTMSVPDEKIWLAPNQITLCGAEAVIKNKFMNNPLMTKKDNAYYIASGYFEGSDEFFANIIMTLANSPLSLIQDPGKNDFRVSAAILKNNTLCISLPAEKPSSAIMKIDPKKAGINAEKFEVKNIVTGKVIAEVDAETLKKGIKISTEFPSEPYVLAIGEQKKLAHFSGIYPDNKVFADMGNIDAIENPEVAISVPDKPGIKVGIYTNGHGAQEIYDALNKYEDFNCFMLPRLDGQCMGHADVIIIPHPYTPVFFENSAKVIKNMVEEGKGLLLTHGSDKTVSVSVSTFPEILGSSRGKIKMIQDNNLKVSAVHPVNKNFSKDDRIIPGFEFDHYAFNPGKNGIPVFADTQDNPVVIAGEIGKGRLIYNGTLPGSISTWNSPVETEKPEIKDKELQLLVNSIRWLSQPDKKQE